MTVRSRAARLLASLLLLVTLLPRPAAASQAFLDLIIETGDAVGGVSLAGADRCTAQAFNEVKTALRNGRLSGGGAWVETDEETRLQGSCAGSQVDVLWFKRTGKLFVRAALGCECTGKGPTDLETGTVRFFVPVHQTQRADGSIAYRIGTVGDFTVEAMCCASRRAEPTLTVFDSGGARRTPGSTTKPGTTGATAQAAPAPGSMPTPPNTGTAQPAPARPTPNAQPAPPQTPRAMWSEHNPCPECMQEKEIVDYFAQRLAGIDIEIQSTQELLTANDRKRLQAQHRIDDIDTRLDDEKGTGGESFDPHTGITIRSYDQGDGTVKVDTIGPDNRTLIDSYTYPRRSSAELIKERAERESEVEAADEEAVRLRMQLNTAQRARTQAQADLEQARRALRDCIGARCTGRTSSVSSAAAPTAAYDGPAATRPAPAQRPDVPAATAGMAGQSVSTSDVGRPPQPGGRDSADAANDIAATVTADGGCDGSAITQPQDLGAQADYTDLRKQLASSAEGALKGAAQKALGGLLGGSAGFSLGGDSMNAPERAGGQEPNTVDDPVDDDLKQTFTDPDRGISIKVGMQVDGDRVVVSTDLDRHPDDGTLHAIVLEDPETCIPQAPSKLWPYRLQQGWSLDIDWTHDTYRDGQLVDHEEGSSHTDGVLDHGDVLLPGSGTGSMSALDGVVPIWRHFGYPVPYGGVQSVGAEFRLSERQRRDLINLAVHVTQEQGDRIRTVVFPLHVLMEAYLTRQALIQMGYRFPQERIAPVSGHRPGKGGGMTQIDPPANAPESGEDILEEIETPIVIN